MYWNIFDENRYKLLKEITETISISNYYLIGGTGLSLQLGLRKSYDFDFCVPEHFNNEILLEELKSIGELKVLQNQNGTCDVILNDVQVSFFYYPNKMINEYVTCQEMPNLRVASVIDIATMKMVAIGGRGSKKDFFDLYNILKNNNISVQEITKAFIEKNNQSTNYLGIIMGLSYFEDAESQELPETFVDYDWQEIKEFFIKIQSEFEKCFDSLL